MSKKQQGSLKNKAGDLIMAFQNLCKGIVIKIAQSCYTDGKQINGTEWIWNRVLNI